MKKSRRDTADLSAGQRSAIIDIGSNTVRLVIYGGARRAPIVLHNEKVAAGLGRELSENGRMSDGAVAIALGGLARYAMLLGDLGIEDVEVVATAAPREAENGPEFLARIREFGLHPRLLSGEDEAQIGANGVLGAFPGAQGVVADLGGGSLELTAIGPGGPDQATSLPLGALRLSHLRREGNSAFCENIEASLQENGWLRPVGQPLYMVGGTWRSLATYVLRQSDSVLDDPHGLVVERDELARIVKVLRSEAPEKLSTISGISSMRAAVLPDAAALLKVLLDVLEPPRLVFSSWGLREGLLFGQLDPSARTQDPLLAGVAAFTAPRGGTPSTAAQVAAWTVDALPATGSGAERLRLAATMLAQASMQIEPNLRARQAEEWALYKRWIGLDAQGRAIIAAALAANCGSTSPSQNLRKLADKPALHEAVSWGLAIRLCRRLGSNSRHSLQASALRREKQRLALYVEQTRAVLVNRGVEKDLDKLAASLEMKATIEIVPDGDLPHRTVGRAAELDRLATKLL